MRYLSVCSGMEAASVAWEPLGWKAVGFSEIEPFPCAILKHRFPNTPNHGSLTEYQSWPIEPGTVDLLVGGTPCQSFSVAGLRKGMADPRGNLALTFLGLADRIKPRWIVWENVPGVLSSNGGRDFGAFLGALVELGYGFAYRVLDAQHFGVPQRRRRVFVVACLGDWRAAASVLFESDCVRRHLEAGGKKRKGPAADAGSGVDESGRKWPADLACTLNASFGDKQGLENQHALCGGSLFVPAPICMSSGQANAAIAEDKAHTLNATHETQTIAAPIVIDRAAFNQGENAQYEPHIGESEVMDSLVARGPHAVGVPFRKAKRAQSTTDDETWVEGEVSNTLNNFDLGDTRTTHAVVQPIAIQGTIIGRGENAGPQGTGATQGGPMFTLTKTDIHGVAHTMPGSVAPTVTSSGPPYSRTGNERVEAEALAVTTVMENSRRDAIRIYEGTSPTLQSFMGTGGCNVPMVQPAMAVRRLTPVECERLQGFPDNWSRIPWKGKPEEECPDGPRYKACGNSMAVPVMRWIGERIAQADQTFFPR